MYVHTRERDTHPGFDGVKIKFYYYYHTKVSQGKDTTQPFMMMMI